MSIDDKDRAIAFRVALGMYLGEKCKYCLGEFKTLDDLDDTVFVGYHEHGRIAHKACWDKHKAQEGNNEH